MNILLINGSPKKRFSASRYFSGVLMPMLLGNRVTVKHLRNAGDHDALIEHFVDADAVVLSVPLYVDGIPSHVLRFLKEAERYCLEHPRPLKLYVISNGGFVEGCQNQTHLAQYSCWCERAGVEWGGGLGIGGGVMLHMMFYVLLVKLLLFFISFSWTIASLLTSTAPFLLLSSGMLIYMARFSIAIRRGKTINNLYTRVMVPSFIFLFVADIFMLLMSLFNGKLIFSLFKRDE